MTATTEPGATRMKTFLLSSIGILVGIGILVAVLYLVVGPPRTPAPDSGLAAFEAHGTALTASAQPPGLSAVVMLDDEVVYAEAFGTQDGIADASPDTVYHWWSLTKMATAVAVLRLAEEGRLELDAPLSDYLHDLPLDDPEGTQDEITVRQLLSHTSGLGDYVPALIGWLHFEDEVYDQTALLTRVLPDHNELRSAPGTESFYTNLGYHVLGAVIEAVTGVAYETYVVDEVLAPLGMTDTGFLYRADLDAFEARGSQPFLNVFTPLLPFITDTGALYDGRHGATWWLNRVYVDVTPSTGLIGSAVEAALLGNALLETGEFGDIGALMQPSDANPLGLPLGWAEFEDGGRPWVQHRGGGPGFATILRDYPDEGLVIVLMANGTALDGDGLVELLANVDWHETA